MKEKICFFAGHKRIPETKLEPILKRLNEAIDNLINQGVTNFMSGGAMGFDLIASSLIVKRKEMGQPIRLIFALPGPKYEEWWPQEERELLYSLLASADDIIYVTDKPWQYYLRARNDYMIEHSTHCISAILNYEDISSPAAVNARKNGLTVINVAKRTKKIELL